MRSSASCDSGAFYFSHTNRLIYPILVNAENVKREERIVRYKPANVQGGQPGQDDLMPDYLNILGMIFSMLGLMMKMKICAWIAL